MLNSPIKKLVRDIFIVNLLAAVFVVVLSQLLPSFRITHPSDFLFYMVIVIWGIAGLTWIGGVENKNWDVDEAAYKTRRMVSGHDFETDKQTSQKSSFRLGMTMFIAGLPGTITLIILSTLS